LSNTNFRRRVWVPALAAVGLEGIHIHDLCHTGNQFTANAGANTRELMVRMGHDSDRTALIYLHSFDRRQSARNHNGTSNTSDHRSSLIRHDRLPATSIKAA
jgi:integrase